MVKGYTVSVSEIAEDGTTTCSTWLTKGDVARSIRSTLVIRYGPPQTNQLFSAQAINDAAGSLPIVQL